MKSRNLSPKLWVEYGNSHIIIIIIIIITIIIIVIIIIKICSGHMVTPKCPSETRIVSGPENM